jgi:uncharacterized protein
MMWDTGLLIGLVVWCGLCTLATMVRLPGTWLILLAAIGYSWWRAWAPIGPWMLAALFGAATLGEVLEFAASAITTRRAGATKQAAWGALLGGVLGAIFLSFLVPIPLVGTVAGALAGCFIGAVMGELSVHRRLGQGARVGVFSAIGFGLGMIAKVALAVAMSGVVLLSAFAHRGDHVPVDSGSVKPVMVVRPSTQGP